MKGSIRPRRNRRSESLRKGATALTAGAVLAGGTHAYATVVRFVNPAHGEPGHFHWAAAPGSTNSLDIRLPASAQPGDPAGPSTVRHMYSESMDWGIVEEPPPFVTFHLEVVANYFLADVPAGTSIPTGNPWDWLAYTHVPGFGFYPPGTQPTYLAARFNPGDGFHYAWIGVVRTGIQLEAFAWGYDTQPGVPIAAGAPEPGSLAVLALGAGALLRRRRHKSDGLGS